MYTHFVCILSCMYLIFVSHFLSLCIIFVVQFLPQREHFHFHVKVPVSFAADAKSFEASLRLQSPQLRQYFIASDLWVGQGQWTPISLIYIPKRKRQAWSGWVVLRFKNWTLLFNPPAKGIFYQRISLPVGSSVEEDHLLLCHLLTPVTDGNWLKFDGYDCFVVILPQFRWVAFIAYRCSFKRHLI